MGIFSEDSGAFKATPSRYDLARANQRADDYAAQQAQNDKERSFQDSVNSIPAEQQYDMNQLSRNNPVAYNAAINSVTADKAKDVLEFKKGGVVPPQLGRGKTQLSVVPKLGRIKGEGNGTSDSIKARLPVGDAIIPANVVNELGEDFFKKLMMVVPDNEQSEQPSIAAKVSNGEFRLPASVVQFFGETFINKLIGSAGNVQEESAEGYASGGIVNPQSLLDKLRDPAISGQGAAQNAATREMINQPTQLQQGLASPNNQLTAQNTQLRQQINNKPLLNRMEASGESAARGAADMRVNSNTFGADRLPVAQQPIRPSSAPMATATSLASQLAPQVYDAGIARGRANGTIPVPKYANGTSRVGEFLFGDSEANKEKAAVIEANSNQKEFPMPMTVSNTQPEQTTSPPLLQRVGGAARSLVNATKTVGTGIGEDAAKVVIGTGNALNKAGDELSKGYNRGFLQVDKAPSLAQIEPIAVTNQFPTPTTVQPNQAVAPANQVTANQATTAQQANPVATPRPQLGRQPTQQGYTQSQRDHGINPQSQAAYTQGQIENAANPDANGVDLSGGNDNVPNPLGYRRPHIIVDSWNTQLNDGNLADFTPEFVKAAADYKNVNADISQAGDINKLGRDTLDENKRQFDENAKLTKYQAVRNPDDNTVTMVPESGKGADQGYSEQQDIKKRKAIVDQFIADPNAEITDPKHIEEIRLWLKTPDGMAYSKNYKG